MSPRKFVNNYYHMGWWEWWWWWGGIIGSPNSNSLALGGVVITEGSGTEQSRGCRGKEREREVITLYNNHTV